MRDREARAHALLFHERHVGFHDAAAFAFSDERGERGIAFGGARGEGVLRGDCAERDAHDGVGARGEHVQLAVVDARARRVANVVREPKAHPFALADPVGLHRLHALGPAWHAVEA